MIRKTLALILCLATISIAPNCFAFNPNDPIGWELNNSFPSTVREGSGPYSAKFTFKNQMGMVLTRPLVFQLVATPASAFTISQNRCPDTLLINETCQVIVNLNPPSVGTDTMQLRAAYGPFAITVPKPAISVTAESSGGTNPPGPPGPPPHAANYLQITPPALVVSYPIYILHNGTYTYMPQPSSQVFLGTGNKAYPADTSGLYTLYYETSPGSGSWRSCTITLTAGGEVGSPTTCPGVVLNQPSASTSNVFTLAIGATAFSGTSTPSPLPTPPNYGSRTLTFVNNSSNPIYIEGSCQSLASCANGYQETINSGGGTATVNISTNSLISGAFFVVAKCTTALASCGTPPTGANWVPIGGHTNQVADNSDHPYAIKIEPTFQSVTNNIPAGATNIDVSAVDGFNIHVKLHPDTGRVCTFTVPPQNSGVEGAKFSGPSPSTPLAEIPTSVNLENICDASSQLPSGNTGQKWDLRVPATGNFRGCMSPCTFATKNFGTNDERTQRFCCTGSFDTSETCNQSSGTAIGANTSTYTENVFNNFQNVYPFAFGDAGSDYSCPADASFTVEISQLP